VTEEIELSPARQKLLLEAIDHQARMFTGCMLIFRGLSDHNDPEVSSISTHALEALQRYRDTLQAMIDGLTATRH
jgi:hypothetical protein